MKYYLFTIFVLSTFWSFSQNIQVDSQTYTPQQLIEDILIDSDCIENIVVTNILGGDFNATDQSYGYFNANGSTFPLQSGLVLSTGRLQNADGPNTTLSDDDAPNWNGDNDLEYALNETNTTNATILEFDFTAISNQISFRYIFASEEYQENNPNTCQYSDLFGFLIRPINDQQYTNIALVPNTQTPVKVTTVHPEISESCAAENEAYFGSWNNTTAPTNFNGQTAILTATAAIVPNQTYHVKLVIADEQNYRYDSAVFLEAGSFVSNIDLGVDLLLANNNALCTGEILNLNAFTNNATSYTWYQDGVEITTETNSDYIVNSTGTYTVEVEINGTCISNGEIIIEYAPNPIVFDTDLYTCEIATNGIGQFNLFDAESVVTNNDETIYIDAFYISEANAMQDINQISNPTAYQNTSALQTVYTRVLNSNGCFSTSAISLNVTPSTEITIPNLNVCDDAVADGFTTFNLNDITASIQNQIPNDAVLNFYLTESEAINETNTLNASFENSSVNSQTIFVNIKSPTECFTIASVNLNVLYTPVLLEDETIIYCLNSYPETITIYGGVLNDLPNNYYYAWSTGENTSFIEVNEVGTYNVVVIDPNGCSNSRNIMVVPSNIATIENIEVADFSNNNSITITVSGEGNYQYAIDNIDGPYQDSNFFNNVQSGFHTIFISDTNNCGIINRIVSVKGFPKFFTPNSDGYRDFWQILGVNTQFNDGTNISIYNRYGKPITSFSNASFGWNGNLNGNPLPTDDYWFVVTFPDGKEYKDHFTLIR